jgi:hypothetical protein
LAHARQTAARYGEEGGTAGQQSNEVEGFMTLRWEAGDDSEPGEWPLDVQTGGAPPGAPDPARPREPVDAQELLVRFAGEPGIAQVQAWAEQHARTNPGDLERWLVQSRRFAVLPDVELQLRVRNAWDLGWGYLPEDGVVDHSDESLYHVLEDAGEDGYAYYAVKASWDLGDLILSNERIRLLNEVQDIARLREDVVAQVTKIYFERRQVQVELELKPPKTVEAEVFQRLKLEELTAELDGMTGGRFSERVKEVQ